MPDSKLTAYMRLCWYLNAIAKADREGMYDLRYFFIMNAIGEAADMGYQVGFDFDELAVDPAFPIVVYIELPTGQLSWHLPRHRKAYDLHSTEEKYGRIAEYVGRMHMHV